MNSVGGFLFGEATVCGFVREVAIVDATNILCAFHDGGAELFVRRHHNKVFRAVAHGSKKNCLVGVQFRRDGAAMKGSFQKPEEVGDTRAELGRKVVVVGFPIRADEKLVRAPRVYVA
jgi:hypothetical protein